MKNKELYQPFQLHISGIEDWEERALVYHFFEIVHIAEGTGIREVNKNILPYEKGNIFLFTPLDCRGFSSKSPTQFCSIRFSEVFLTQYKNEAERERILTWLKQLEQIFYQHNRFTPVVINNEQDREMLTMLINSFVNEVSKVNKNKTSLN